MIQYSILSVAVAPVPVDEEVPVPVLVVIRVHSSWGWSDDAQSIVDSCCCSLGVLRRVAAPLWMAWLVDPARISEQLEPLLSPANL